jgi:hypothetical protein
MGSHPFRVLLTAVAIVSAPYFIGCGAGTPAGATSPASPSTPSTPAAAPPAIAGVSPATMPADSGAFSLQITGTGFVSGSVVSWNGTPLVTTFISATALKAAVTAALAAGGGSFTITVANPDGQNSDSSNSHVVIDNPLPAITSLSPASITAGSPATNVTITGTGFLASSVASFGGQPRATSAQSSTQLTMALTAADFATPGQVPVTVANPAPGGGSSAPLLFTVSPPPPVITGVTPSSLLVQSGNTPVTIQGSGFTSGSVVNVSGYQSIPVSVTATAIQLTIPAYVLNFAVPLNISVITTNGESNVFSLPVLYPLPAIQSVSVPTVTAGAPGFVLNLQATGVLNATVANLNGVPLAASANPTQVPIPASALAQVGTISVSLTNPAPGGGTSNVATVHVIAGENYLRTVNLPANALVGNPGQQLIYAAIAARAANNASSVVAINPGTGSVVASRAMSGEPTLLAISGDQQYLYVGMTAIAAIARLKLPSLTPDIQWTTGPLPSANYMTTLYSMQVAPGLPHTLAVAQQGAGVPGSTELAIYDDDVMRPNKAVGLLQPIGDMNVLQWGADASTIYGGEGTESGAPEFIYSITAQGAALTTTYLGALNAGPPQLIYDSGQGRLYTSGGDVVDAASGKLVGSFPAAATAFALDSVQRRAYFLGGTSYGESLGDVFASSGPQIAVFDQDRRTNEGTIVLPSVEGGIVAPSYQALYLVRWGTAGLAFNGGNNIYILDGPFVTPGALPSSFAGTYATPVPQLSALSPESVVAGSPDVTITLTGQNFTPATTVNWRDLSLATTVISNTEVQAVIPAAALSSATAAPLYVQNSPGEGISNPVAFSVLPQLEAGTQLAVLNLSGVDLAWNASNNLLYVAVANTNPTHPASIATVDPAAGKLVSVVPLNANPHVVAISGDDQELYVGFADNASVQRYALPGLSPDLLIPLGIGEPFVTVAGADVAGGAVSCAFAASLAVAPGENSTFAVSQSAQGSSEDVCGDTAVVDGATPRPAILPIDTSGGPDLKELTWGADGTALYAQGADDISRQPIYSLTVSSAGIAFHQSDDTDIYLGYRPHFDAATGLIYSDGGAVTQPSTLTMLGNFQASGLMVPDSKMGLAYFLGQTPSQVGGNYGQDTENYTLQIYDLKTYALLNSIVIPNIIGFPIQMVRWGSSGIAFTTIYKSPTGANAPGLTYLLSGPALSPANSAVKPTPLNAERVQFTWQPRLHRRRSAATRASEGTSLVR